MKEEEYLKVQAEKRRSERLHKKEPPEKFQKGFLEDMDERYNLTHELRDRHKQLTTDLGGIDALSYAEKSLIERSLWIEYFVQRREKQLLLEPDKEPDIDSWFKGVKTLEIIFSKLGLKRKAKEVQSITDYLKSKEQ